jgi:uncharacterized membrane protein
MSKIDFVKKESPIWLIILAYLVYTAIVWNQLPSQLPIHFNLQGEANDWGPKWIFPIMVIGIYLLLLILPFIDPRKKNYKLFEGTYYKIRLFMVLFFVLINSVIMASEAGANINRDRLIMTGVLGLIILLGNYFSTLKPNWFIGIRLPWTLESESNWKKTHHLAGRLWFWIGLALLFASFILPSEIFRKLMIGGIILLVAAPIGYSFYIFQKEKKALK